MPWFRVKPSHWKLIRSSSGFVYKAVKGGSNFWICGWNLKSDHSNESHWEKPSFGAVYCTSSEVLNFSVCMRKFFKVYLGSSASSSTWFFSLMSCSRTVSMMSHSMSLSTPSGEGPGSFREWSEYNKHSWLDDPISHKSCYVIKNTQIHFIKRVGLSLLQTPNFTLASENNDTEHNLDCYEFSCGWVGCSYPVLVFKTSFLARYKKNPGPSRSKAY